MEIYDIKEWLDEHGTLTEPSYMYDTDLYRIGWKAHGGYLTVCYGKTRGVAHDNLYRCIKNGLFEWCEVHEQY